MGRLRRLKMSSPIREIATNFLSELGVSEPPLPIKLCLQAEGLSLADETLDELLDDGNNTIPADRKPDAMLYVPEKKIWLKEGLHMRHLEWAPIHELGHYKLPWQRELLRFMCLFDLPESIQKEWELEADLFTVECRFLGHRFHEEALSLPFSLVTPWRLANLYGASYESAFRHYVEGQPHACCLLVSRPTRTTDGLYFPSRALYEIQYYVNSSTFRGFIGPRQQFSCPELLDGLVTDYIIDHELPVKSLGGLNTVYYAQSFSNTYKIFTLLSLTPFESVSQQPYMLAAAR